MILADTTTTAEGRASAATAARCPRRATAPIAVWAEAQGGDVGTDGGGAQPTLAAARNEYRRLLYVAMTRAAERLVVCGAKANEEDARTAAGISLCDDALRGDCVERAADDGDGEVLRYRKDGAGAEAARQPRSRRGRSNLAAGLAHARCPTDKATRARNHAVERDRRDGSTCTRRRWPAPRRLLRGSLAAPAAAIAARYSRRAARQGGTRHYLARRGDDLQPRIAQSIADEVMRMLDDPRFAELFAPGSRAEVPIVGRLSLGGAPIAVSGQVDRLVVTAGAVLIGDYKTDRPPPRRIADVPAGYLQPARALPRGAGARFIRTGPSAPR